MEKSNIPWELLTDSFTGNLSPEDAQRFNDWLSSDPANSEKYSRLTELWEKGLEDYTLYQQADESNAWKNLSKKINSDKTNVQGNLFIRNKNLFIRNLSGIAAGLMIFILISYLLLFNNKYIYKTAFDEKKQIKLKDGTEVLMKPQTTIKIARDFNETERIISIEEGEAEFEVVHLDIPFIINAGPVKIKDLGTGFIIKKDKEKIYVEVSSGKIAFVVNATDETKELTEGMNITFETNEQKLGEIKDTKTGQVSQKSILNFNNAPLSEVISSVQKIYGNRIGLADSALGTKKLTADFYGVSFENIITIICKSLNLNYSEKDSTYLLIDK